MRRGAQRRALYFFASSGSHPGLQTLAGWPTAHAGAQQLRLTATVLAGFAYHGNVFGPKEARTTIGVNYHGTVAITEALKELVPPGGRIINICSGGLCERLRRGPSWAAACAGESRACQVCLLRFAGPLASTPLAVWPG